MDMAEWPDRLPGYKWLQSPWYRSAGQFLQPPFLVVVHSGANAPAVAEYLRTVKRTVSAHFAWSEREGGFVQMVGLQWRAWHAGGSVFLGDPHVNSISLGIELPGPFDRVRDDAEMGAVCSLLSLLRDAMPCLTTITSHAAINPKDRRDPGPFFRWDMVKDIGLAVILDNARDKPHNEGTVAGEEKIA